MKKPVVIGAVVVVVIAVVILVISMNHKSTAPSAATTTSSTSSTSNTPAPKSAASTSNAVTIQNFAFSAADITVKKGTAVTWTNQDSTTHTVTENDGQTGPDSGDLATGKSYSFTFNTPGTYKYHCSIHPDMTGTVTVTD